MPRALESDRGEAAAAQLGEVVLQGGETKASAARIKATVVGNGAMPDRPGAAMASEFGRSRSAAAVII